MSKGNLEQQFRFELIGLELPRATNFQVPERSLQAELRNGIPIELSVRVEDALENEAKGRADAFVTMLYRRLLLTFGSKIELTTPPRLVSESFKPFTTGPEISLKVGSTNAMGDNGPVVLTVGVSADELDRLARDVETRTVAPEAVTSAQLYTAIAMYCVGLQTQNKVVRFLVFYSSLALAALFKWHDSRQEKVDQLLLQSNSGLAVLNAPPPRKGTETIYTKLRNEFIHAEERGCEPEKAIAAIESKILDFHRDVCLVLSGL